MSIISIANDFSVFPGGRVPEDGPFNGEKFRNHFLIPALEKNQKTTIDFDGARGYGSSFLEEAFGGLVRHGFQKEKIKELLTFKSSKQSIIIDVNRYIDNAKYEK